MEATQPTTQPRLALVEEVLRPIAEEAPCGTEASWEEPFRRLKAEINRSTSAGGRIDHARVLTTGEGAIATYEGIDYAFIVEQSRALLYHTSKDLRIVCYLTLGLFHTQGIPGLAQGLAATERLVATYWDHLYPLAMQPRARKGAFLVLNGRLAEALVHYTPTPEDAAWIAYSQAVLATLQAALTKAMGEAAPPLHALTQALGAVHYRVPEAPPKVNPEAKAEAAPPAERPPDVALPSSSDRPETSVDAVLSVFKAAAVLRRADAANPVPYRLTRAIRWGSLPNELPNERGRTLLEPPPASRCAALRRLANEGRHSAVLKEAEGEFQNVPFHVWLDLQRLVASALEALGASYEAVRATLRAELAHLLRHNPTLPTLTFRDGTPFADAETQAWLDQEVRSDTSS